MTMRDVVELCRSVGIEPTATPLGVQVGTTGWRIESGGGIAGNSDKWWLQTIAGAYHPSAPDATKGPYGPAGTIAELKEILFAKWPRLRPRVPCPHCNGTGRATPADPAVKETER